MPDLFHVGKNQCLNYGGPKPKKKQKTEKQFALYDSDTPVTLKQDQGHQIEYELVDTEQGYDNAMFEKSRWNSVREKPMIEMCQIREYVSYLP